MVCHVPDFTRSWIDEKGSLTARLRAVSASPIGVHVLRQGWRRSFFSEALALDLPMQRRVWVREVLLHANGSPLVLARTVVPPDMLQGAGHGLTRLGDRPLGELLFAYRKLGRQQLAYARLPASIWQASVSNAYASNMPEWGRRSLYETLGLKLLVCEFFFPVLFDWAEMQK